MSKHILIMGLSGAGKTKLANQLYDLLRHQHISVDWINADKLRTEFNDWDFSREGRIRQCARMKTRAQFSKSDYVICDFIAPLKAMRDLFDADFTVWLDTVQTSNFADTDAVFEIPENYDLRILEQDADKWSKIIVDKFCKLND